MNSIWRALTLTERDRLRENTQFKISKLSLLGLNSTPALLAYEPAQSLLCVAFEDGRHFLFSSQISYMIFKNSQTITTNLTFAVGEKFIIATSPSNTIRAELLTHTGTQTSFSLVLEHSTTCLLWIPLTRWLLCGTPSGLILAVHCNSNAVNSAIPEKSNALTLSEHSIRAIVEAPVVALSLSPTENNKLLIAYENNTVVLWDLLARSEIMRLKLKDEYIRECGRDPEAVNTTAIAWSPSGNHFVSTHADIIVFWSTELPTGWLNDLKAKMESNQKTDQVMKPIHFKPLCTEKPPPPPIQPNPPAKKITIKLKTAPAAPAPEASTEPAENKAPAPPPKATTPPPETDPISKIEWVSSPQNYSDGSLLFVCGGSLISGPTNVFVFEFASAKDYTKPGSIRPQLLPLPFKATDFVITNNDSKLSITIQTSVNVHQFELTFPLSINPQIIPASLHMLKLPPLICSSYAQSTPNFLSDLLSFHQPSDRSPFPFNGGNAVSRTGKQTSDLLLTVHGRGRIEFWQMTCPTAKHITSMKVGDWIDHISGIEMDAEQRLMVLWGGNVTVVLKLVPVGILNAENTVTTNNVEEEESGDVDDLLAKVDRVLDEVAEEQKKMKHYMTQGEKSVEWGLVTRTKMGSSVMRATVSTWFGVLAVMKSNGELAILDLQTNQKVYSESFHEPVVPILPSTPTSPTVFASGTAFVFIPTPPPGAYTPPEPPKPEPSEITIFQFADMIFPGELSKNSKGETTVGSLAGGWDSLRCCLFIGTAVGIIHCIALDVNDDDGLSVCGKMQLIRSRTEQKVVFVAVLDHNGVQTRTQTPKHQETAENFVLVSFEYSVRVYLVEASKPLALIAKAQIGVDRSNIVSAGVSYMNGESYVVVVTVKGVVVVYNLPDLIPTWEGTLSELSSNDPIAKKNPVSIKKATIMNDGRISVQYGSEWVMYSLPADTQKYPEFDVKCYELSRQAAWVRKVGGIKVAGTRSREMDEVFGLKRSGASTSGGFSAEESSSPPPTPSKSANEGNLFGQQFSERGEKLEHMEEKFSELADSSKSFLDNIKAYNEAQAKKKWWQL
ncbi:Syntaxin-binding protein 5 [Nowakowskiella sp. JEL0407]|nr:Syntaxin-binding protein 5 [Nowakowskiella sp. JEL0407]